MTTFMLIAFHIVVVSTIYCTAYRTGYKACVDESRRKAEAHVAPLKEMLERLNMDAESILDEKKGDPEK